MSQAYTPGLKVAPRIVHRVQRRLPIAGQVRVAEGARVSAQQVVAQTHLPGDVYPVNLSSLLSLPPGEVPGCMLKGEGQAVAVGEPLARTPGLFGLFKTTYRSKVAGVVESVSPVTGQVILRAPPQPVEIRAFLAGRVVRVWEAEGVEIEAAVSYIQGIFGIGGEAYGPIRLATERNDQELTAACLTPEMAGALVVGGARIQGEAIRRALDVGVAALIGGGLDDQDLRDLLGYDLGVAVTGSEQVGLTLILTEGFGDIAMAQRTFQLLAASEGRPAAVNGATQIRAGVMRPEIVIPWDEAEESGTEAVAAAGSDSRLHVGRPVRIIRDPHFGKIGSVSRLPADPAVLDSGSKARVLEVRFDSGETVTVPRANVELIEE